MRKVRLTVLGMLLMLTVSGCGDQKQATEDPQQTLKQEGMERQAAGDYEGAIAKYEEALRLSDMEVGPEEIDLAYYKASAQYRNGDLSGAIDTYSAILALRQEVNGYLGRGLLYIEAGDAKKAEKDLNQALNDTDSPLIKGIIYDAVGESAKAKEYFEEARAAGEVEATFFLANVYEKSGDHNYAMILLEEYISGDGASAEGYLTVGRAYYENGAYEDALTVFQGGIARGESGVLKSLLREEIACYEQLGDYASATQKAAEFLADYPDDALIAKEYEFLKSR